jgi:hypothetical protein
MLMHFSFLIKRRILSNKNVTEKWLLIITSNFSVDFTGLLRKQKKNVINLTPNKTMKYLGVDF